MASLRNLSFLKSILNFSYIGCKDGCKSYSQWAPSFKSPLIHKSEIEEAKKKMTKIDLMDLKVKSAHQHIFATPFYHPEIEQFIRQTMQGGKYELARDMIEKALINIKHIQLRKFHEEKDEEKRKEIILDPKQVLIQAVENCSPIIHTMKIKRSGTWYQVPRPISKKRAKFLARRFIITICRETKAPETRFITALTNELLKASNKEGEAYKRKVDLHKLCETNRAFAHYTWT